MKQDACQITTSRLEAFGFQSLISLNQTCILECVFEKLIASTVQLIGSDFSLFTILSAQKVKNNFLEMPRKTLVNLELPSTNSRKDNSTKILWCITWLKQYLFGEVKRFFLNLTRQCKCFANKIMMDWYPSILLPWRTEHLQYSKYGRNFHVF